MTSTIDDFTRRLLIDAGVCAGMRVFDVGCGAGDVALLAGNLVGEQGHGVGVDREAGPLAVARDKAREGCLTNVMFEQSDLQALPSGLGAFDAAIGRRVLMYQPDAIQAVRHLARSVRTGGLIIFQEHESTMTPASLVPLPLHRCVQEWCWRTVEREGGNIHMGFGLHGAFTQAGLSVQQVRAEAIVQTPDVPYGIGGIVRATLPPIIKQGVARRTRSTSRRSTAGSTKNDCARTRLMSAI
jgi:SAM-dependent methyltransferase